MRKLSLLILVNRYIDDEKKRNDKMRSKSTIYEWINEDVKDELIEINAEYREINNKNAKKNFRDKIIGQFETKYFKSFLKNKSETPDYYDKLLDDCIIHIDTIQDFLDPENDSNQNPKTLDFFRAFCKRQEREHGEELQATISTKDSLLTNAIKTETLEISGATIINEEFINSVKLGKEFMMPEFYGAKQNNKCQWYGIINDFDVFRNGYEELKEVVIDSFLEEKDGKVTAIVHGTGGSGKSTVLRRLAIDFHAESFDVIWLEKGKVEEFVEKGLIGIKNEIEKNENRKFLIVIEDWYRMFDDEQKVKLGNKILEETFTMNNTRLVIADRDNNKQYRNYRNNKFELHLSSQDNKEIIEKITEKYPNWKIVSEKLFEKEKFNQSSLFLLLFIIARINQNDFQIKNSELAEPEQIFQNIIESDLNFIAKEYIGIAKALYYMGCAYSKYKVTFSYEVFIRIANYYNENKEISPIFSNWKINTPVNNRLKQYFSTHQGIDEGKTYNYIRFNHDILVDEGLSKLHIRDWNWFDDKVKYELLQVITKNDNHISASTYLYSIFIDEEHLFEDEEQKLNLIENQINKENQHYSYLFLLNKLNKNEQNYLAKILIRKKFYAHDFWNDYFFSDIPDNSIFNVLTIENIKELNRGAVYEFLYNYVYERTHRNKGELPIEVLKHKIPVRKFAEDILKYNDWKNLDYRIIELSLSICNETIIAKKFSNNVLNDDDWLNIDDDIIADSIILAENNHKENFIKKVLTYPNWRGLPKKIVLKCLQETKNQELIIQFSNTMLIDIDIDIEGDNQDILAETVKLSLNKELAFYIISNYKSYLKKSYSPSVIVKALGLFKNDKKLPLEVSFLIEYILNIYPDSSSLQNKTDVHYIELMGLGLHNHTRWEKEAEYNLLHIKEGDNNELLLHLLLSYRPYPNKIEHICLELLPNWKKYNRDSSNCLKLMLLSNLYSTNHFQIALGHPSLKTQAKTIALEISETSSAVSYLKKVALDIVENDIYPEWEV